MRRALRTASSVLIVAGVLLIVDAGVTFAWQEPVSALIAAIRQDELSGQLDRLERAGPSAAERAALARMRGAEARMAFLARALRRRVREGDPIGRITMPTIGASYVVVQGTGTDDLRKGPGHYPATTFPGLPGTVAIAGHRTTYGAPFHNVNELRRGAQIHLRMPYGAFTYVVEKTRIVPPTATWVTRDVGENRLVLSACHPLFSAAKRIVVFAREIAAVPRGAALTR